MLPLISVCVCGSTLRRPVVLGDAMAVHSLSTCPSISLSRGQSEHGVCCPLTEAVYGGTRTEINLEIDVLGETEAVSGGSCYKTHCIIFFHC